MRFLGGKEHIYLLHRDYIHVAISSLVYLFFFFYFQHAGFTAEGAGSAGHGSLEFLKCP